MNNKSIILIISISIILSILGIFYYYNKANEQLITQNKIRYIDLAGNEVFVKENVERIVLLRSKDIYSLAVLLGDELPKKLIAWGPDLKTDDADAYQKFIKRFPSLKDITVTGSVYNNALSVEQIVNLQPDLIIADKYMIERGYWYMKKLINAGLPVVCLDGSNDPFKGPQNGITLLGKILKKEKKAKQITDFVNDQISFVLNEINTNKPKSPSVYLEAGVGGPEKFGQTYGSSGIPKTYTSWGAVLHQLKVNNIADGIASKMESINPEYVLSAEPDVIIITGQNWNTSQHAMQLGYQVKLDQANELLLGFTTRPGWKELSAVKNKRIYSVFHNSASIVCFASIQALSKYFYPSHFPVLNPEENLKKFYEKFMPVDYSGVWMIRLY
ncbi:ABC transporter substrate-binding protein [Chondrinema litorale]|uniref:ABC transporter substrate-binding protein n=1 Tax=Chondrinema litorale TaxID=2994555 RepID=UPI0025428BB2|nr:ABC transporter substrate-binding protein [Chondrinema litorale]UZR96580.1 ABC transporter substrate-binding protein [Chondrinema litorale]